MCTGPASADASSRCRLPPKQRTGRFAFFFRRINASAAKVSVSTASISPKMRPEPRLVQWQRTRWCVLFIDDRRV